MSVLGQNFATVTPRMSRFTNAGLVEDTFLLLFALVCITVANVANSTITNHI